MTEQGVYQYSRDVNYVMLDRFKVAAQEAARKTAHNLLETGAEEILASRGESCFLWQYNGQIFGGVVEGLGTKNRALDSFNDQFRFWKEVAEKYQISWKGTGLEFPKIRPYFNVAIDTAMMIFIDMIACGIKPQVLLTYYGVGASEWFEKPEHIDDYCDGTVYACNEVGCAWGGGETPCITNIIYPDTVDLCGAAFGVLIAPEPILGQNLKSGNKIMLVESTGLQANYLSGARRLASKLPAGYLTPLSDGTPFGAALSVPTDIRYIRFIESLILEGVRVNYIVPITGHGLRKIMRARQPFTYRLHTLAPLSPLFRFMIEGLGLKGKSGASEAIGGMNLGQGMALMMPEEDMPKAKDIANNVYGLNVWEGGVVKEGPRQVIIENPDPIFEIEGQVVFTEDSMQIRART